MKMFRYVVIGLLVATAVGTFKVAAQPASASTARDFSGVWLLSGRTATFSAEAPPPMTAWGARRFAGNRPTVGENAVLDANDPTLVCLPPGVPYVLTVPTPFEIIHTDDQILQIFEYNHSLRRIHVDGRKPADLGLTGMYQWMGYSVGHWDDDTLVIETSGFNDRTWLDRSGRPHSEELRVVERLFRIDHETLVDDITIYDPKAYLEPWHGRLVFELKEDWEIFEHACISEDRVDTSYLDYKNRAWRPAE